MMHNCSTGNMLVYYSSLQLTAPEVPTHCKILISREVRRLSLRTWFVTLTMLGALSACATDENSLNAPAAPPAPPPAPTIAAPTVPTGIIPTLPTEVTGLPGDSGTEAARPSTPTGQQPAPAGYPYIRAVGDCDSGIRFEGGNFRPNVELLVKVTYPDGSDFPSSELKNDGVRKSDPDGTLPDDMGWPCTSGRPEGSYEISVRENPAATSGRQPATTRFTVQN
jgi:hypothetical protein